MKEKLCKKCGCIKPINEFHVDKYSATGYTSNCRDCRNKRCMSFMRTKRGLCLRIYHDQKKTSKRRNYELPLYSFDELYTWLMDNPKFHTLFDEWVSANYDRYYVPSVDRIDDYKSYSFDNIQLMKWSENNEKGYEDRRNGVNNKINKPVKFINLSTGEENTFNSVREAQLKMNISFGEVKKANMIYRGLAWSYINN